MSVILRILLGLLIIVLGFHMVWKTTPYLDFIGRIDFAEDKFGPGGTHTFLKLVGLGIAFLGVFIATNIISDILNGFASIFIRG